MLRPLNERVLMRFLHEFNGNWYVWSGNKNGQAEGGPEKVVAVWKYVVDRFRKVGADNVKWMWVPHGPSTDRSEEAWNNVSNYWPGDDYVDWIGLDGYNFLPCGSMGRENVHFAILMTALELYMILVPSWGSNQ
jgi:mannan endo-1,4-beta-mannosidase